MFIYRKTYQQLFHTIIRCYDNEVPDIEVPDIEVPWKIAFYSGDLNSKHLNNGNIWIKNFYVTSIQMIVRFSKFSLVFIWQSINGGFWDLTTFDHLNTRLVRYLDPHSIFFLFVAFFIPKLPALRDPVLWPGNLWSKFSVFLQSWRPVLPPSSCELDSARASSRDSQFDPFFPPNLHECNVAVKAGTEPGLDIRPRPETHNKL